MYHRYMLKISLSFVFSMILLTGALFSLQARPLLRDSESLYDTHELPDSDGVSILDASETGLSLVLNTVNVRKTGSEALSGLDDLNAVIKDTGAPELPYFTTFIALPPEATASIEVTQKEPKIISNFNIQAVPEPTLSFVNENPNSPFPLTAVSNQKTTRIPDASIYSSATLYPNYTYKLSEPMYFRDMRLVKLDLYPLQYRPLQQELVQTEQMIVKINFHGGQLRNLQPIPSHHDVYQAGLANMILNFEQGKAWRSLPASFQSPQQNSDIETAVSLPSGAESYKIEINQDGIYDITGQDLISAGMAISNTNPATIELMSRGESVAYQFIKNGANTNILEQDDIIRFYGEGVNGSRREKQFLTHNIYWLWPNGSPITISSLQNTPGTNTVTHFTDTITREDENYFFSTWTNQWDQFPNEPDSWYWALLTSPTSQTYEIDLPDPVLEDNQATFTVEFLTRESYKDSFEYPVEICLNSQSECVQKTWFGHQNINITKTVPITTLVSGTNEFTINLSSSTSPVGTVRVFLNRITVEYLRALKAENDQLFFTDSVGGRTMVVQDFSEDNLDNILVWDISSPLIPKQVTLENDDIAEHNGRYTYTVGIASNVPQNYIVTTVSNTLTPDNISQYLVPNTLEPVGGADWVAISYGDFLGQATRLANHRTQEDFGGMKTHVVNIEDVINLYYHGLAMPEAIHAYLEDSLTWSTIPSYVVLVGDGLVSPRNLHCVARCYADWDMNAQNFVPTDMQFADRYQGLVPTDSTHVFLIGDDLLADMAIGRLTAETNNQAQAMVDKIIRYEENLIAQVQGYERVLFLADFPDPAAGGSFCDTNQYLTGSLLPSDYEQTHLCIEDYTDATSFLEAIKNEVYSGAAIVNYRGHGAIHAWGNSPRFWNADSTVSDEELKDTWANDLSQKPVAILSADCLDGHFAWSGHSALSERFMKLDDYAGSAAHWSSSGLGLDHEHTVLLEGFYKSLFGQDQVRIGDAANYAKLYFSLSSSYAESEMFTFNLQGDPAMQINIIDFGIFLPVIVK